MGRNFIVLGDPTSHGGVVISAWGQDGPVPMTIDGIPVACIGDRVSCPKKGHSGSVIIQAAEGPVVELAGKPIARAGDKCSCGAVLESAGQSIATHSSDSEPPHPITVLAEERKAREAAEAAKGIQTADATPGISAEEARMLAEQQKEDKTCKCGGPHPLKIVGNEVKPIKSYTGDLPSPLLLLIPKANAKISTIPHSEIRRWVKEAAEYHEVPYEMLAVILQQENAPNVSTGRKVLQFGERSLSTLVAGVERMVGISTPAGDASTGIMNMRRPTLQGTIRHTKENYNRSIVPSHKSQIDRGRAGEDFEADMYYLAAHVRQLIDKRVTKEGTCAKGTITLNQVREVFADYNGPNRKISGKYGDDSMAKLNGAYNGTVTLYFYE